MGPILDLWSTLTSDLPSGPKDLSLLKDTAAQAAAPVFEEADVGPIMCIRT